MPLRKYVFRPGINKEGTNYSNEGGWFDADKVRFRKGRPERIGGWQKQSTDGFIGTSRKIHTYKTADGSNYITLGTHQKFYVLEGNQYADVTPIRATTTNGITFAATNGSTTITATDSSHGAVTGDFVTISEAVSLGGNITAAVLNQEYQIDTVPNANTFTLTSTTSQTASGNCTFSAEFSNFNTFVNGVYVARGFKFKAELTTNDPAQSIELDQLGYTAELKSRTETSLGNAGATTGGHIASGTSTKSVAFTNSFFTGQSGTSVAANSVLPSIGITIENAQQGDFFALSSITGTGFDIDVKNSSGSNVNRNFKYAATGFGRGS